MRFLQLFFHTATGGGREMKATSGEMSIDVSVDVSVDLFALYCTANNSFDARQAVRSEMHCLDPSEAFGYFALIHSHH